METHDGPEQPYDPRDALADVAASRTSVADRLITPWWYHPALGVILAAIVLVTAGDTHSVTRLTVVLASAVAIGALVNAYQRTTGMWVNLGNLGPTSLRWWIAYLALVVVIVGVAFLPSISDVTLPDWLPILLAATILVGTIVLGRGLDEAMRVDIRSGASIAPTAPTAPTARR